MGMKRRPEDDLGACHFSPREHSLTICKKVLGRGEAAEGQLYPMIGDREWAVCTWAGVSCTECLAKKPALVHAGQFKKTWVPLCTDSSADVTTYWKDVTCEGCLKKLNPTLIIHAKTRNGRGDHVSLCRGHKDITSTDDSEIQCLKCKEILAAPAANPLLEKMAATLIVKAVVASRNSGFTIVRGNCRYCSDRVRAKDKVVICIPCSLIRFRNWVGDNDIESDMVNVLGLPNQWVLDFIGGTDGDDKNDAVYKSAYKLGAKVWKKYGDK